MPALLLLRMLRVGILCVDVDVELNKLGRSRQTLPASRWEKKNQTGLNKPTSERMGACVLARTLVCTVAQRKHHWKPLYYQSSKALCNNQICGACSFDFNVSLSLSHSFSRLNFCHLSRFGLILLPMVIFIMIFMYVCGARMHTAYNSTSWSLIFFRYIKTYLYTSQLHTVFWVTHSHNSLCTHTYLVVDRYVFRIGVDLDHFSIKGRLLLLQSFIWIIVTLYFITSLCQVITCFLVMVVLVLDDALIGRAFVCSAFVSGI